MSSSFDPTSIGLPETFRLTDYRCKIPQAQLVDLLDGIGESSIGMDCSIIPLRHKDMFQVSTIDFFYPLVEDPYLQGRIACANVLSDLYALGVVHCDTMLMTLSASLNMDPSDRMIVTKEMMRGFNDLAKEAETDVTGGQSILNPWAIIGGVAMSVCTEQEMIRPIHAVPGDLLVLTKPLGTQLAVNAHQWLRNPKKWDQVKHLVTEQDVLSAYAHACESMSRLNRRVAMAMHRFECHGATDVTGFGILGHASNLAASMQYDDDEDDDGGGLRLQLDCLPVLRHMMALDLLEPEVFKLARGLSAETSGGILTTIAPQDAHAFIDSLDHPAWIVGSVVAHDGPNDAVLLPDFKLIEV